MEISEYITSLSTVAPAYADEVEKLRNIAKNNLSGVITTNYDLYSDIVTESMIKNTFRGQTATVLYQGSWQRWRGICPCCRNYPSCKRIHDQRTDV